MEIFILKTNVLSLEMKEAITPALDGIPEIKKWSIDYQDCDGVLRASVAGLCQEELIGVIRQLGYQCEELNN
ncbi:MULTISPECIES: hypothetical protein [Emticicia]|uniref:hypothetical protein n=1 Tax=Emticicia TaxID=312278 RepID=UPI000C78BA7C|nr:MULTISPECIES: hypothetical protein [Emticicia]PLK43376.1 hypothetical protein C0V77_15830 [Emticicia sp. TH156]UTA68889.1 hypothetical protein MB380_03580 [Emticicia sp. 21SJ11W-3]